jgi:hypothetical protein
MKRVRTFNFVASIAIVAATIGLFVWWYRTASRDIVVPVLSVGKTIGSTTEPFIVPPIQEEYTNSTFRFSLGLPDGFRASELPSNEDGAHTIVLQNEKGEGIQIYVTPNQGDVKILSADDVRASIPDMKVSDEQEVEIGPNNRGVAFMSDSEAFGGASREVWFYFRGNLYQISTYARLDPLLQSMFSTWKFL